MDLRTVDELLTTTRAVRRRLDLERPVDLSVISECLRIALQAPTGGNAQSWRFMVVTQDSLKAEIAKSYRVAWESYSATARSRIEALPAGAATGVRRVTDSAQYLAGNLERVPVHVIPCALGRPPDGSPSFVHASFYGSIFPSVWSFQLALRSRGLGSTLTTLHLHDEERISKLLGIPSHAAQCCLLPVAWTRGRGFSPAARRPVQEVAFFNRWDEPLP